MQGLVFDKILTRGIFGENTGASAWEAKSPLVEKLRNISGLFMLEIMHFTLGICSNLSVNQQQYGFPYRTFLMYTNML